MSSTAKTGIHTFDYLELAISFSAPSCMSHNTSLKVTRRPVPRAARLTSWPRMLKRQILLTIATVLALGCSTEGSQPRLVQPRMTTIADLLRDPVASDGELVTIRGPAIGMFEVSYICDTLEDVEGGSRNCLWIDPGELSMSDYHQKVVDLVGRFDRLHTGHMGAYAGSIHGISVSVIGAHSLGVPPPIERPN